MNLSLKGEPMTDDVKVPKAQRASKVESPKQEAKKVQVRPVHGVMVHMLTNQVLDGDTEVPEIDSWLQAQIDAGKIVVV